MKTENFRFGSKSRPFRTPSANTGVQSDCTKRKPHQKGRRREDRSGVCRGSLRYYDTAHGRTSTRPFAGRTSTAIERGVCRGESSRIAGIAQPPPDPPTKLTPKDIQQRFNELFGDMPSRPDATPTSRRPDPSTPEELQQRLNETFAGMAFRTPGLGQADRQRSHRELTPEEIQQRLNEAFGPWEWLKSHPSPGLSSRRRRSLFRASEPRPPGRRAVGAATRESRTFSGSARTASGSLAASFAKAGRWRTGVAGCMAALRPGRGRRRARRVSSPRWSRGGASGLSGDAPRGGNSLRVASAARDG